MKQGLTGWHVLGIFAGCFGIFVHGNVAGLGQALLQQSREDGEQLRYLTDPVMVVIATSTFLIAAAGYIINDYYDIKIDFINRPDEVVVGKTFKRRWAMVLHTTFSLTGVALGFMLWWGLPGSPPGGWRNSDRCGEADPPTASSLRTSRSGRW